MKTIKGIIPPMITPLKGDDQIDREGTVRLTEHILAGGVHAINCVSLASVCGLTRSTTTSTSHPSAR